MNYNKKRMIVALHLTVSSVMLLSGFTSRDKDEYRRRSPLCGR